MELITLLSALKGGMKECTLVPYGLRVFVSFSVALEINESCCSKVKFAKYSKQR